MGGCWQSETFFQCWFKVLLPDSELETRPGRCGGKKARNRIPQSLSPPAPSASSSPLRTHLCGTYRTIRPGGFCSGSPLSWGDTSPLTPTHSPLPGHLLVILSMCTKRPLPGNPSLAPTWRVSLCLSATVSCVLRHCTHHLQCWQEVPERRWHGHAHED